MVVKCQIKIVFEGWICLLHHMIFMLCLICMLLHLGITILLASGFAKYTTPKGGSDTSFSVVIAACNEKTNLKRLLPKLLEQDHSNFEIIIALDRCVDKSKEYLESLGHDRVKIIEVRETEKGWNPKKYALKQAVLQATNDWLVYTDADCVPASRDWLKSIENHIVDGKDIIIGVSPYQANKSLLSYFIQFESFMTAYLYVARTLLGKPYMSVGRNMAVKRFFFEQSTGYEGIKSINGGDDDLFIQQNATKDNTQVMIGADSLVYTFPKTTWNAYWHQKIRHLSVGTFYRSSDRLFLGLFHASQLITVILLVFLTTQAFFFPMLLFYLFIKLVSYRFAASKMGVSINYILLPLVDTMYALLIPLIAMRSKLEKDIKWKN